MVLPSGEKRANISNPGLSVSLRATPPEEETVYRFPAYVNTI
jgi:hypothetical protein